MRPLPSLANESRQKPLAVAGSVRYPACQSTIDETNSGHSTISEPAMFRLDSAWRTEMGRPEVDHEPSVIPVQLLALNDGHKIVIHTHAGELWVAEFCGERAELVYATSWFRLLCGVCHTSFSLRRALRAAAAPSNEMVAAIKRLHQRRLEHTQGSKSFFVLARGNVHRLASVMVAKLIVLLGDRRTSAKTRNHRSLIQ